MTHPRLPAGAAFATSQARFFWLAAYLVSGAGLMWAQTPKEIERTLDSPTSANVSISTPSDARDPVWFSRVHVPLSKIAETEGEYFPLTRDRFESLVAAATNDPSPPNARVVSARYEARFVGGELIDGTGELAIERSPASEEAGILPLDGCGIPMISPVWEGLPEPRPAVAGRDARGRWVAKVPSSGKLTFQWSLRGAAQPTLAYRFRAQLPKSLDSVVALLVPDSYVVRSMHGLADVSADATQTNRWTIRSGTRSELDVLITPRPSADESGPIAVVSEETSYEVSPGNVLSRFRWEAEVLQSPAAGFVVGVPAGARIRRVAVDGETEPFDVVSPSAPTHSFKRELHVAADRSTGRIVLEVDLITPCPLGTPLELPRIQPQGMVWRSGSAKLIVRAPLQLTGLETDRCWQSDVSQGSEATVREFALYSSDARIQVQLDRAQATLEVRQGTTVTLGSPNRSAVVVIGLSAPQGEVFRVEGQVHGDWVVDSIQLSQPELMEDWQVTNDRDGPRWEVRLRQPIRRTQSARLTVVAHQRTSVFQKSILPEDLRCLSVRRARIEEEIVCLRSPPNQPLQPSQNQGFLPVDELLQTARFATLVSARRGDLVFRPSQAYAQLVFLPSETLPKWSGRLETIANASRNAVSESYMVEVTATAATVEKIHVHLMPSRDGAVRWSTVEGAQQLSARRLESASLQTDEEVWEVQLPESKTSRISLVGRRAYLADGPATRVTVLSLPEAASQRSAVEVRLTPDAMGWYDIQSSAERLPPTARHDNALGRFLIDSGQTVEVVRRASPRGHAWIAEQRSESRLAETGEQVTSYRWYIENRGQPSFELTIPKGGSVRSIQRDGEDVPFEPTARRLSVTLPEKQREILVTAEVATVGPMWRRWMPVTVHSVEPSLPVLRDQRFLFVTRDWRPHWDVNGRSDKDLSWKRKLFGWLARDTSPTLGDAPRYTVPANAAELTVIHLPTLYAAACALFGVASIGGWFGFARIRWRRDDWVAITCGMIAVLFLVSWPWAILLRGWVLGWLAAGIGLRLAGSPTAAEIPWPDSRTAGSMLIGLATLGFVVGSTHSSLAEEAQPRHFQVLIPNVPAGEDNSKPDAFGYVYVPTELVQWLVSAAERRSSELQGWLVKSLRYRASIEPSAKNQQRTLTLEVNAQLQCFAAGQQIEFALPSNDEVAAERWQLAQEVGVKLDGESVDWDWGPHNQNIRLLLPHTGTHLLQFSLHIDVDPQATSAEIPLLSHPNSVLELLTPRRDMRVSVAGRKGRMRSEEDGRRQRIELGPTDRVTVTWSPPQDTPQAANLVAIGRFDIDPGAILCDLWLRAAEGKSLPPTLRVDLGPSLQPLPSAELGRWLRRADRDSHVIDIQTNRAKKVRVRCLHTSTSGLGELQLPEIRVEGCQVVRTIWAGDVNAALSFEEIMDRDVESVAAADWQRWQPAGTEKMPDFMVSPRVTNGRWRIRTYPRRSVALAEMSSRVLFDTKNTELVFRATMTPLEGRQLRHRFRVPDTLTVASVDVTEKGTRRPFYWAHREGVVHILMEEPAEAGLLIEIQAFAPHVEGPQAVPLVSVDGNVIASHEVVLLRDTDCRVTLENVENLQTIPNAIREANSPRVVSTLQTNAEAPASLSVSVVDYRPVVTGRMVTALRFAQGRWWADADVDLSFPLGVPDQLTLELDDVWGIPEFDGFSGWEARWTEENRRQLELWPPVHTSERRVRGRLTAPVASSSVVETPKMRVRHHPDVDRYVVVPTEIAGRRLDWRQDRTRVTTLPDVPNDADQQVFRLTDAASALRLPTRRRVANPPVVLFSESRWWLDEAGAVGDVRLVVNPRGSRESHFRVPETCQLKRILVEGRTAMTSWEAEGLRVSWGPSHLPQSLRMLVRIPREESSERISLTFPTMDGIPTAHQWSVASREPLRVEAVGTSENLPASVAATRRKQRYVAAWEHADVVTECDEGELRAWIGARAGELWQLDADDAIAPKNAATIERLLRKFSLENQQATPDAQSNAATRRSPETSTLPFQIHLTTSVPALPLTLHRAASSSPARRNRWAALLALACGLLLALSTTAQLSWKCLRFVLPAVLGLVWILYLRFPLLGAFWIGLSMLWAWLPPHLFDGSTWHLGRVLLRSRPPANGSP